MDYAVIILAIASVVGVIWIFLLAPWLGRKGVDPKLLEAVTLLVREAVGAAEQLYKEDGTDRRAYVKAYMEKALERMGLDPGVWSEIVPGFIKAAVRRLPKTHTAMEDPAVSGVGVVDKTM